MAGYRTDPSNWQSPNDDNAIQARRQAIQAQVPPGMPVGTMAAGSATPYPTQPLPTNIGTGMMTATPPRDVPAASVDSIRTPINGVATGSAASYPPVSGTTEGSATPSPTQALPIDLGTGMMAPAISTPPPNYYNPVNPSTGSSMMTSPVVKGSFNPATGESTAPAAPAAAPSTVDQGMRAAAAQGGITMEPGPRHAVAPTTYNRPDTSNLPGGVVGPGSLAPRPVGEAGTGNFSANELQPVGPGTNTPSAWQAGTTRVQGRGLSERVGAHGEREFTNIPTSATADNTTVDDATAKGLSPIGMGGIPNPEWMRINKLAATGAQGAANRNAVDDYIHNAGRFTTPVAPVNPTTGQPTGAPPGGMSGMNPLDAMSKFAEINATNEGVKRADAQFTAGRTDVANATADKSRADNVDGYQKEGLSRTDAAKRGDIEEMYKALDAGKDPMQYSAASGRGVASFKEEFSDSTNPSGWGRMVGGHPTYAHGQLDPSQMDVEGTPWYKAGVGRSQLRTRNADGTTNTTANTKNMTPVFSHLIQSRGRGDPSDALKPALDYLHGMGKRTG
jgi:hypothetical protein